MKGGTASDLEAHSGREFHLAAGIRNCALHQGVCGLWFIFRSSIRYGLRIKIYIEVK